MSRITPMALVAIVMCACATDMQMTARDLQELGPDEGLVLGSVSIQGGTDIFGRTGWKLEAEKTGQGLFSSAPTYSIHATRNGDEEVFLTRMPAGSYHFFKLVQTGLSNSEVAIERRFDVQAGKTVYVGRVVIEFPPGLVATLGPSRMHVEDARQETVDRAVKQYGVPLSDVVTALMAGQRTVAYTGPRESTTPPPDAPQPLSSFEVEFVPAGSERYPPTETTEVVRFKNVLQYPGEPETVLSENGKPTRPYVEIGALKFGLNWYYSSNIRELIDTNVPRVGGDAVLVYHAHAGGAVAVDQRGDQIYYQSIVVDVIRYTDR